MLNENYNIIHSYIRYKSTMFCFIIYWLLILRILKLSLLYIHIFICLFYWWINCLTTIHQRFGSDPWQKAISKKVPPTVTHPNPNPTCPSQSNTNYDSPPLHDPTWHTSIPPMYNSLHVYCTELFVISDCNTKCTQFWVMKSRKHIYQI